MIQTVSVIIPSLGNRENLKRVLESLKIQDLPPEDFEVLIVLNGVGSVAAQVLRSDFGQLPFRLVVEALPDKNVNKARNRGIALAKKDILLFLDDDCSLTTPSFLRQHVSGHLQRSEVFGLGGGYSIPDEAGFLDRIYNYLQMRWLTLGSLSGKARFLLGGNFSVKKLILIEHDLQFDDAIAYGGSEFEFFVKADGKDLLMNSDMPDVLHHTQETLKGLTRKNYLQGRGAAIIDRKYPNRNAVGFSSITDPAQSLLSNIMFLYFNYAFWAGYHATQGKIHQLFFRIIGDGFRAANFYRYEFLKKISKIISEKDGHS